MSSVVHVAIHQSQSPEVVRRDRLTSLRTRRINHKFHYDSIKQTNRWLALHEAYSPSRTDDDCAASYDRAFDAVASGIKPRRIHLVGLGCGGGQKDARLLQLLRARGKTLSYTPSDVSVAMTLVARRAAARLIGDRHCLPLVCDLTTARDLPTVLDAHCPASAARLVTFFGLIPNFEPQDILPKLAGLVRRQDVLLFSANLSPGADYAAGLKKILPQYANAATREWLLTFLLDLGVERSDGVVRFNIEPGTKGLARVVARFQFQRARTIGIDGEQFVFRRGRRSDCSFPIATHRNWRGNISRVMVWRCARSGLRRREKKASFSASVSKPSTCRARP